MGQICIKAAQQSVVTWPNFFHLATQYMKIWSGQDHCKSVIAFQKSKKKQIAGLFLSTEMSFKKL